MEHPYFEMVDLFVSNHPLYYRIPIVAPFDSGLVALANCRLQSYADSAEESHVVCRTIQDNTQSIGRIQGVFDQGGWNTPIGTAIVDQGLNRLNVTYQRWHVTPAEDTSHKVEEGVFMATKDRLGGQWKNSPQEVLPNKSGYYGYSHGSSQGITIREGSKKGRLIAPARFFTQPGEDLQNLQENHYNCALISDDHGETWQTSGPAQPGTGEGCLVEMSDGRIYYNSRAYFLDGKRRVAWSHDGGETFTDFDIDQELTEPLNGGCNAGMVLYPAEFSNGRDIILFSNPAGEKRDQMTVRASFDGGFSWPVSRLIYNGPAAYSSLSVDQKGHIHLLFENGQNHPYEKISLASFSFDWLMDI